MKTKRQILLLVAAFLMLLTACGTPATATPTAVPATEVPTETEIVMEPTATDTETPVPTPTVETPTPTPTGPAGTVPVSLVCWFCIRQVPHVIVTVPQTATYNVVASSAGVMCSTVETVDELQVVLCKGPAQAGNVSFDLNVCSGGQCSERHLAAVDCSGTAMPMPTATFTLTVTPTPTGSVTAGLTTSTPGMGETATSTPMMETTSTPTALAVTATITPTP